MAIWTIFNWPPLVDSIKHGHLLRVILARLNGSIERRLGRGGQLAERRLILSAARCCH